MMKQAQLPAKLTKVMIVRMLKSMMTKYWSRLMMTLILRLLKLLLRESMTQVEQVMKLFNLKSISPSMNSPSKFNISSMPKQISQRSLP